MRIIGGIYEQGLMMKNTSIYSVFKVLWRVWHLWHWHFDTKAICVIFCYGVKVSKCHSVKVIFPWLLLCSYKHTNPLIQVSSIDFPSNLHRICIEFASALQRRIIGGSLECLYCFNRHFLKLTYCFTIHHIYELSIKIVNLHLLPRKPDVYLCFKAKGEGWRILIVIRKIRPLLMWF